MDKKGYIKTWGIDYNGALNKTKKSDNNLQPIFEALTNAIEAIKLSNRDDGKVLIRFYFDKTLHSDENKNYSYNRIEIEDNGIGFNDKEFSRLINLYDETKGFYNKGSGRIQYLHFFDKTEIKSVFCDDKSTTGKKMRSFSLSKNKAFLQNRALIRIDEVNDVDEEESKTIISFKCPLDKTDLQSYKEINIIEFKSRLLEHYLEYFCENRETLPKIRIEYYLNEIKADESEIISNDIPKVDKERELNINYCKINGNKIEKTEKVEVFKLKAFKISKDRLNRNGLKLVSKGEIAKELELKHISESDHIDNYRYLFLLSNEFINNRDGDKRGDLRIPKKADFKKNDLGLFDEEEILLEDIEDKSNEEIEVLYHEIKKYAQDKINNVKDLQKMFLLNEETIGSLKIGVNDSDDKILEKYYQADVKITAKRDAEIKKQFEQIKELDTTRPDEYEKELQERVDELVKSIPIQNRTALTQYISRRKIVLDVFKQILDKQLEIQKKSNRNINEKLLHNLIFQQSSNDPENSELWLINEDFIYFKETSESHLKDIKVDNELIFKEDFKIHEDEYLKSLGENRLIKKPDILLFPDESKCIIIEFKNPDVPVRMHLQQIDFYAGLIRNFTKKKLNLDTFYGYLIGEKINPTDVRLTDQRFIESYNLDYMFRPSTPVAGDIFPNVEKKSDGAIYIEVIKYSTLLARAKKRNEIFMKKLGIYNEG